MSWTQVLRAMSACLCLVVASSLVAHDHFEMGRADSHAPIGVMGDHTHKAGEWMVSYRTMFMTMDGNRDGTNRLSSEEVLQNYMVSPLDMDMVMHMVGVMYAPSDKVTLMAMFNYIDNEMNHVTRMGMNFKTDSDGLGDTQLGALWNVFHTNTSKLHLNLGVSVPTGDTDVRGTTPMGPNVKLPYPMQIGTGTLDFNLGATYSRQFAKWSYGTQLIATLPTGENDEDYTVGNRLKFNFWAGVPVGKVASFSFRVEGQDWDDFDGADPELNPRMVPTADPNLRGGTPWDAGIGLNLKFGKGRLAAEYLIPFQQDLDGPQLEVDNQLQLGWQYSF